MSERQERCDKVNALFRVISMNGREFFRHKDDVAYMEIDYRGRIWFVDAYTRRRIYTHYAGRWRGFTNGGTMQALVNEFKYFIQTGAKLRPHTLGPWPETSCRGDRWGYGEDMQKVRDAAKNLGLN